ncbi:RNA-dependent RNA polymerase 1 [Hyphodiscus hymeniophilus]|uniref:RNA-dependent RNA polymerase n=1 Tax=Hyphodiscus hymeniophilus TaxID=353542 RepID=A0A9P6VMC7_9HELO|nr:RNA-dependent RNA polymerase 1 [Hyphodiscus hymeniophilus]
MIRSPRPIGRQGGLPAERDWSRVQRAPKRQYPQGFVPLRLKPGPESWQMRPEFSVRMRTIHPKTTTYDLHQTFKQYGNIVLIEIFQDRNGAREGGAKIRFSPPPSKAFWKDQNHIITNTDGREEYYSPIKKMIFYEPKMKLFVKYLHFGITVTPNSVMPMHTAIPDLEDGSKHRDNLSFVVDLVRRQIVATFHVTFTDPRSKGSSDYESSSPLNLYHRVNKFMFQIPFEQVQNIKRVNIKEGGFALIIALDSPPQFYRKREDEKSCHSNEACLWTEFDTWFRQTDILYEPYRLQRAIVTLHKERPVIDIGRWKTYVFVFDEDQETGGLYNDIKHALQDFNIPIVDIDELCHVPSRPAELWSLIDPLQSHHAVAELQDGFIPLPFEVRYQLEVCISRPREIFNEHNISREFVTKLAELASKDVALAKNLLEYVAAQDKRIFDPMAIFKNDDALAYAPKSDIPHYCAYIRKATVTPTTIHFSTPTVETTNRVLRHYARETSEGRFLRVQFTDEDAEGRINSCADKQRNDELFTRVYRTLFNGIRIGERHYEFLAFGNSQFRENGAYFFCPTDHLSCDDIRHWMGNFSEIKVVAKYAARLGQCFSTTRAINGMSAPDIVKIPDIEIGKYCFTDGVGKISPFLAQMITAELGLRVNTAPSVFQFRLGGCKGILAVWPDAKDKEVHIRPSQQKFAATYNGLEIIRWSRFSACALNRQTITILSSLGVPDEVFVKMLTEQLHKYHTAMHDNEAALSLLCRHIDDNHMTINIASMINNGFMTARDPFFLSLLHLWRSWSLKLMKEKAKIIVEDGAFLLGCVDETKTLRGYTKSAVAPGEAVTEDELPQIFVQVPARDGENMWKVIEGICLVGRNPSLHPGDLRVVQAVNVPALHHLRDVVVFPSTGDRDVPGMCSGGDLDGDDFFVIWDKALQPTEINCEPMNFDPPEAIKQSHVKKSDLMKFFVRFMKNDSLPTIAHAHLGQSDFLPRGIKDPKCLELAALHSKAVDYVKTGQPAEMPKRLRMSRWPHFMEKKYKPMYHSDKILGQLYDKVQTVDFVPQWEQPFDKRILRAYKLDNATLKAARQVKSEYDMSMRRLMAQQEIKTEFEVWSTFVLSKPRVGSDYKVQETMAIYSDALKEQYRTACMQRAGCAEGKDFSKLGPFVAAMYKVTKEELDIALAECRTMKIIGGRMQPKRKMEQKYMPLISFPWLFEKELGRIATGWESEDDLAGLGLLPLVLKKDGVSRKHQGANDDMDDFIQQEDGVIVHRGEELDLFRPDVESDDLSGESDYEEARSVREDGSYIIGDSGEVVLNTVFQVKPTPAHLLGGTGLEDVVPRTELDGFVQPLQTGTSQGQTIAHETPALGQKNSLPLQTPALSPKIASSATEALTSSIVDLMIFDEPLPDTTPAPEHDIEHIKDIEDLEEEEINLEIEESSLEKLARMMNS